MSVLFFSFNIIVILGMGPSITKYQNAGKDLLLSELFLSLMFREV